MPRGSNPVNQSDASDLDSFATREHYPFIIYEPRRTLHPIGLKRLRSVLVLESHGRHTFPWLDKFTSGEEPAALLAGCASLRAGELGKESFKVQGLKNTMPDGDSDV
jgi:hypothetical protein